MDGFRAIALGILASISVGACAAPAASTDATSPTVAHEAPRNELGRFTAVLDTLEGWVELDPAAVNHEVEQAWKVGLEWPRRALDVALRAVGEIDAWKTEISLVREGAEGPSATTFVLTRVGLADDSVGGIRDEIDLAFQLDGSWRVVTHWRSLFCPRGPGRGAWMAGPCN